MFGKTGLGACVGLALLAGCGDNKVRLDGPREAALPSAELLVEAQPLALNLPSAQSNASWTHIMGDADHHISHPALGTDLQPVFSVSIGSGESDATRISAAPVVANGRVFTIDAHAQVAAVSTSGQALWARSIKPNLDRAEDGAGGGLAYGAGRVFASSGFGKMSALDPETGRVLWTQDLDAPAGAPTVANGLVYVMGRDGTAWALDVENGRIQWTARGSSAHNSFGTGVSIASAGDLVILPFPGGELRGNFARGGLQRWNAFIAGARMGVAATFISDITADPVVAGGTVYSGNIAGRAAALNATSGEEIWSVPMAAKGPMQSAGNSVFFINDLNELVRLNSGSGALVWQKDLPKYAETRRANRFYAHYGPILAGGRLNVASSDGYLRQFDPQSGGLLAQLELPAPAAALPAVAGGVIYVVTTDGQLTAYR